MAGDTELIEAQRRNSVQMGKLVLAMQGLTEAIRLQAEAQHAMAAAIAKVATMDEQGPGPSAVEAGAPEGRKHRYMDERADGAQS